MLAGTGRIAGMARSYTTLAQADGFILLGPARPAWVKSLWRTLTPSLFPLYGKMGAPIP